MDKQITAWLNWLKVSKRPYTVSAYDYLLRTMAATAPGRRAEDWTTDQLLAYLAAKRDGGLGDAGIKQIVGAMRNFFGWLHGPNSPALKVPYPKLKRRLQRTLDAETMFAVLATCDSSPTGTRDLAMLTLMLDTGLRAFEVCDLKLDNLDLDRRRLSVIVKGGNEAEAVYSNTTRANLARWLAMRLTVAAPDVKTVFVSVGGLTPGQSLTTNGLRVLFRSIGKRSGIKLSPHDLRRTFATLAIRNGAPTRIVQAAGRWADVTMVEHYTAAIQAEDFERYSPVEAVMERDLKRDK